MKKMSSLLMLVSLFFAVSCKQAPKADEGKVEAPKEVPKAAAESQNLKLDAQKSVCNLDRNQTYGTA